MNSIANLSAEPRVGPIQYSHALSAKQAEAETPLSPVRTKTFRIPFAPFKQGVRLQMTERDRPARTSVPTATAATRNCGMAPTEEPLVESIAFSPEQLLRRSQTKTVVLEEALQRSEWSQHRFWGINE